MKKRDFKIFVKMFVKIFDFFRNAEIEMKKRNEKKKRE